MDTPVSVNQQKLKFNSVQTFQIEMQVKKKRESKEFMLLADDDDGDNIYICIFWAKW